MCGVLMFFGLCLLLVGYWFVIVVCGLLFAMLCLLFCGLLCVFARRVLFVLCRLLLICWFWMVVCRLSVCGVVCFCCPVFVVVCSSLFVFGCLCHV